MSDSRDNGVVERGVRFHGAGGMLAGTLAVPGEWEPRGAVVLLAGSGRVDRDGNAKRLRTQTYLELAHAITQAGFVTLRYDKRGVGESEGNHLETGLWDLVADAEAAVAYLRELPQAAGTPLLLLGHSEGCILAPAVNARTAVDGLILLAGACESLEATLRRQQELAVTSLASMKGVVGLLVRLLRLAEKQRRKSAAVMERLLSSDEDWLRIGPVKMNARWIREHFAYDVTGDLAAVRCPTLAMTGTKDVQVLPEDARRIADRVGGEATWHLIPEMTHMLRRTSGEVDLLKLKKLYVTQGGEPIDAELVQEITAWLDCHYPMARSPKGPTAGRSGK